MHSNFSIAVYAIVGNTGGKKKRFTVLTSTVDGHEAPSTVDDEEEAEMRRRSTTTPSS